MADGKLRILVAALLATLVGCQSPEVTPAPVIPVAHDPYMYAFPDCEDTNGGDFPCVTFDEDEWRTVESYEPYRYTPMVVCGAEDGGPVLPCVGRDRRVTDGMWLVFTKTEQYGPAEKGNGDE